MEPQFIRFDDVRPFVLAPGVHGRPLFGEGAMLNLIEFEPGATVPYHGFWLVTPQANSCRFAFPTTTAPASTSRRTAGAVRAGT